MTADQSFMRAMDATAAPPPEGVRVFAVGFEGPHGLRRSGGTVLFEALARLDGVSAAEAMRLVAQRRLRVGYRLHGSSSSSPVAQAGHAAVEAHDAATLRCRFLLPGAAFAAQPQRLLHVGLLYEGVGSFEDWGQPGAWLAVGIDEPDLFGHYHALTRSPAGAASTAG